ncbi:hypothetical protein [Arcobacter sp. FWKO B]|uniref:hypothetical protein n=1 Tax=Arcobacter sp. FWKO B TaxID=2593672 RepID=UPI0018A4DB79|nr:hypothetical protein [Arcobacter sp. FWKO B]QOG12447.1 hypothetical protein FWKOB_06915 [Arcobacter sp. FWKO B]
MHFKSLLLNYSFKLYATNFGNNLAFYTDLALDIIKGGSLADTNNHNQGVVTEYQSVFNTSNILIGNNKEFVNINKSAGDDLTYNEAQKMIKNINGMVIYKKPDEIGGYMVGTPQESMDYLMTGKSEEEKNKLFINRVQRDISKGFQGLSNSLDKLYNLDTSKMTPEGKLMFDYLNLKINTVPSYGGSEINQIDKSQDRLLDEIKKDIEGR